ncbi:hypothetical protein DH2020_035175 [Rehmannia glutinosa]|uniref:No apical meristem-associated C-terminal domain-containing protein n=1 Tax=Rehmannia glutinosa TaxID=99300 RepID=A0ABR0VAW1_REHGL
MASHSRSASYDRNEDIHLCHVYLDISQNPIIGINQSKDQFWSRVAESYNSTKPYTIVQERNKRSLQCRMQVILHAVSKFRGCVRQIEILNPGGASEQDILNRATELLIQDKKYKKGFKFDHVWPILKDIENFANVGGFSSQSDTQQPESPMAASPGLSSFSINLSDDNICPTSSERPIGIKKSKLKRKTDDGLSSIANAIQNETQQIVGLFNNNFADRQNNYKVQMKKLEMLENENKTK